MKTWLKVMLALTATVAICVTVVSLLRPEPYVVTRQQYELIDVGMAQTDVENLLGGPPRNCLRNPAMVWIPHPAEKLVSARINPGPPTAQFFLKGSTSDDGLQVVWLADGGLIAAVFGEDGRLQQKYFSTVHDMGGPSGISRLWARPAKGRPAPQSATPTP